MRLYPQNLSPSSVSDLALIYVDDRNLDIDREFNNWIATLVSYSSFFGKNPTSSHINHLYKKIIKPVLEFTMQGAMENKLVFYLSNKYLFMHFMSFFEIFLNEARKIKVAFGQLSEEEIEEGSNMTFIPDQRNALKSTFLNRETKSFQEEAQTNQNTAGASSQKKATVVLATADDILKIKYYLEENVSSSPLDKLSFIIDKDKIILTQLA